MPDPMEFAHILPIQLRWVRQEIGCKCTGNFQSGSVVLLLSCIFDYAIGLVLLDKAGSSRVCCCEYLFCTFFLSYLDIAGNRSHCQFCCKIKLHVSRSNICAYCFQRTKRFCCWSCCPTFTCMFETITHAYSCVLRMTNFQSQ